MNISYCCRSGTAEEVNEATLLLTDLVAWQRDVAKKADERAQGREDQNAAEAQTARAVREAAVSGLRRPAGEDFFKCSK